MVLPELHPCSLHSSFPEVPEEGPPSITKAMARLTFSLCSNIMFCSFSMFSLSFSIFSFSWTMFSWRVLSWASICCCCSSSFCLSSFCSLSADSLLTCSATTGKFREGRKLSEDWSLPSRAQRQKKIGREGGRSLNSSWISKCGKGPVWLTYNYNSPCF